MTTIEKIKWLNRGIALGKMCRNLTDGKRRQEADCGTQDYEVEDVDGELEKTTEDIQ